MRWVRSFLDSRDEWERMVNRIVGEDKFAIFEIMATYSLTEVAIAYAYWAKDRAGFGYLKPKKKKGRR